MAGRAGRRRRTIRSAAGRRRLAGVRRVRIRRRVAAERPCRSQRHQLRLPERGLDRRGRGLAEPADRRVAHRLADLAQEGQLILARTHPRAGRQPREQLFLADAADAARHALAARLVAEELGDPPERVDRSAVSSNTMITPEPSVAPVARVASNVSGMSSASRTDEDAGRAAEQDRPDVAAARDTAGELDQVAQRRAELDLVYARAARRGPTGRTASGRSSLPCRSPRTPRRPSEDERDVDQGLDVVDDRRLAEEADLDRERRLVARLAALALDRLEERRLLAADVGAGAAAELDVEGEAGAEDVRPEEAGAACGVDRVADPASASGYSPRM